MYGVGFDDVFSCEEVMYEKCRVGGCECIKSVFENDICLSAIAIEKGDVCVWSSVKEGTNHAHTGGDTNPTRDENEVWCNRLIRVEKTIRDGSGEGVAYFTRPKGARESTHFFYGECEKWVIGCATDAVTFSLSGLEARESHREILSRNEVRLLSLGTKKKCGHEWRLFFFLYNSPSDARWHGVFHNRVSLR